MTALLFLGVPLAPRYGILAIASVRGVRTVEGSSPDAEGSAVSTSRKGLWAPLPGNPR